MDRWYAGMLVIAVIATIAGIYFLIDKFNRKSIARNIEANGGKVIEILKLWGEGSRSEQVYEVSYMTGHGERRKATCKVSAMSDDVSWISRRPPGTGT